MLTFNEINSEILESKKLGHARLNGISKLDK